MAAVARTTKIKAMNWGGLGVSVSVAVILAPASSPVPMATTGLLLEGRHEHTLRQLGTGCREVTAIGPELQPAVWAWRHMTRYLFVPNPDRVW
jgi:hypothetical protein